MLEERIIKLVCKNRLMSGFFTACKDVRISDINCLGAGKKSEKGLFYKISGWKKYNLFGQIRSVKCPGCILFKVVMLFYRCFNIPDTG